MVIRLEAEGRSVTLEVRDDGDGMPPRAEDGPGMGLRIMRYRAGLIGATLHVGPDRPAHVLLPVIPPP